MRNKIRPIPQELIDSLEYRDGYTEGREDGHLYWKNRPLSHFQSENDYKIWNIKYCGEKAGGLGSTKDRSGNTIGYLNVNFSLPRFALRENGRRSSRFGGHRVIWLMHNLDHPQVIKTEEGYLFPMVDHREDIKMDGNIYKPNRPKNLRLATLGQNGWNRRMHTNNTTGVKGVYYDKCGNRYRVQVKTDKYTTTQTFSCNKYGKEEAFRKAKAVAKEIRTKTHGEFARHG